MNYCRETRGPGFFPASTISGVVSIWGWNPTTEGAPQSGASIAQQLHRVESKIEVSPEQYLAEEQSKEVRLQPRWKSLRPNQREVRGQMAKSLILSQLSLRNI